MARERRSRRDEASEAAPAAGGRGERPAVGTRVPQGPSFALTVGFSAGVAAAALAFLGAFLGAAAGADDPYEGTDNAGIQAARMLAAPGIERWRIGFGSTAAVRQRMADYFDKKLEGTSDSRDKTAYTNARDEFRYGKAASGVEWRPGFDMIFPPNDPADDIAETARKSSLERVVSASSAGILGAAVFEGPSNPPLVSVGDDIRGGSPTKKSGDTEIYAFRNSRQYAHPVKNASGTPVGRAVVHVAVPSPPSPLTSAGLAALAALIGGFAVGFGLALGPVKSIRRLATDTGALADGKFDTRILVAGPDVVQAAAKNVQRLAQLAASGALSATAEPQIIQQQVMVQPVAEVQEGLGPMKSFRRPDELEIEATQKPCPDLGNDYYDVVNVDDEHVGVFVADIPNMRGVRGALFMSQIRAIFRAVSPREQSPAEVLKLLNRAFAMDLPRGIYVTAMYAVVNRTTGICRVASAQHLPLVFWKLAKKASARLAPEGIALGLDPGPVFDKTVTDKAIQLDKGDRIVLFTDGAISAKNLAGAEYGEERFYYVLNREAPKNSAACVNFVANDVDLFHEGAQQTDDFTIVTLRRMK